MRQRIVDVILWWARLTSESRADHLAEDFTYDTGGDGGDRKDFQRRVRIFAGAVDLKILEVVVSGERAAAFFDFTDKVSGLRYRCAWLVHLRDDLLVRLIEARSTIFDDSSLAPSSSRS